MPINVAAAQELLRRHGQEHVLRFYDSLSERERLELLAEIEAIPFDTLERLIHEWVLTEPSPESFRRIEPVPVKPPVDPAAPDARQALEAGEQALRQGRVGLVTVAGGQGTRLGYDGPKGSYPIGPISKRSLFAYHAEKILNLQRRYGCVLPWYIMVSGANAEATRVFFEEHAFFGLNAGDVVFFQQKMMPGVDERGKLLLSERGRLALNPNGHGGCILALVDEGITGDARRRGVDTFSYFQVDNWAVKVADPYFIGYHVASGAEMSSKVHRKTTARESVGVHCVCDGEYRVIEYSELDIYPQLLETDTHGNLRHFAGNPAIHILDRGFVERVYGDFEHFPWHRAHKKIPYVNEAGEIVTPDKPNGYKFETFIFDALRLCKRPPVSLEIRREGEYTPIKDFDGANSVVAARRAMREYWGKWLETTGATVPRDGEGRVAVDIEISPAFALDQEEFVKRSAGRLWDVSRGIAIGPGGEVIQA